MAKEPKENGSTSTEEASNTPMLQVIRQYIKDASFENPNAPETFRQGQQAPEVSISIEIGRNVLTEDTAEVILMLKAEAKLPEMVMFVAELEYAGLFTFQNVTEQDLLPLMMIECPRILFPFARQILADLTHNGGYPPIMLDPPDFPAMFRAEMVRRSEPGVEGNA